MAGKGALVKSLIKCALSGQGIQDLTTVSDRLDLDMAPAPRVLCIKCGSHVAYLRDKPGKDGSRLAPTGEFNLKDRLICPVCDKFICMFTEGMPVFRTDQGYK